VHEDGRRGRWDPRAALAETVAETVDRVRLRGRPAGLRLLRLTGAAVLSYAAALELSDEPRPVLAPLTALLVVQLTLFSTVKSSAQRVVSVVSGVLLAAGVSSVVGLTAWSLGGVVAVSLAVGMLLRLGDHLLEVPISAMLVLAVGGAPEAVSDRIVETLIGAGVGLAVNTAFPPAVQTPSVSASVERFAAQLAQVLDTAGTDLVADAGPDDAAQWLEDARRLTQAAPRLHRGLDQARESRRLNIRALGTVDALPTLHGGIEALERTAFAVRLLMRSLLDGLRGEDGPRHPYADEVRAAVALLLHDLATCVRTFGRLLRAESQAGAEVEEVEAADALEALREARARVVELLLVDPHDDATLWELNSALLATVERVLQELDTERHLHLRERRPPTTAELAAQRVRATTRHLVEAPRLRDVRRR
jgi:uncharacterized membrane protein YgaE (UPF0421/DUF939 family)